MMQGVPGTMLPRSATLHVHITEEYEELGMRLTNTGTCNEKLYFGGKSVLKNNRNSS